MTNIVPNSLHALYLQAMDISVWVRREIPSAEVVQTPPDAIQTDQPPTVALPVINSTPSEEVQMPPDVTQTDQPPTAPPSSVSSDSAVHELDWESLQQRVANCTACALYKTRTKTVFGVGDRQADLMLIGEAPGADEDAIGEPFVGQAGQLLNAMLYAIDFKRESVYITNVIKCRPPDNRNPLPDEMSACNAFLQHQIDLIQPKLIVAVGGVAAHHLLSTDTAIGKLRGQRFEYGKTQIPLIATYHPAYLLRRPTEKRRSWQDLQFIRQTI